jgi:hypothetical protein
MPTETAGRVEHPVWCDPALCQLERDIDGSWSCLHVAGPVVTVDIPGPDGGGYLGARLVELFPGGVPEIELTVSDHGHGVSGSRRRPWDLSSRRSPRRQWWLGTT